MKGKVKWFNAEKGYGFINGEDGKDIFVPVSYTHLDVYKRQVQGSHRRIILKHLVTISCIFISWMEIRQVIWHGGMASVI